MSIESELIKLNNYIKTTYTAIDDKGGTIPSHKNMANLPDAVASIQGGGGIGIPREVSSQGVFQKPTESFTYALPNNATDIGVATLYYSFSSCSGITSFSAPNLTSITNGAQCFSNMCTGCQNLSSISFPMLASLGVSTNRNNSSNAFASAFNGCTSLTSVSFPELSIIYATNGFANAFQSCTSLTSVSFAKLTQVGNHNSSQSIFRQAFMDCSSLTSISFDKLEKVQGATMFEQAFGRCGATSVSFPKLSNIASASKCFSNAFYQSPNLRSLSFPAFTTTSFGNYTNAFNNMLSGCTNVVVHFPSSIQTTISGWSDVTNGFGGTNTSVLYDL